jgi:CspA family cold shock protein
MREKGIIKRYLEARGFGFISRTGAPDAFFHCREVYSEDPERTIQAGASVEFEVQLTEKGLQAVNVVFL